jgi:NAD(P)-dependent dehydrogenase (short-subunit alcohol dehydrogenase family)
MNASPGGARALDPAEGKAVLVTGCSSGIGHAVARYLSRRGFTVFATVRREADARRLEALADPNLVPTWPLDLTRREHLAPVVELVSAELRRRRIRGLHAVVNNAGGGSTLPVELLDLDGYRRELEARLLGPVALLQATLPLVREARGRILWIATPALLPIPFVSDIHSCDFAVNCLARTLDLELRPWGIRNVLIRCGTIRTAAPERTARELREALERLPPERRALYERQLARMQREFGEMDARRTDPEVVGETVYRALTARKPKRRYPVGRLSRLAALAELLPQTWVDALLARRAGGPAER